MQESNELQRVETFVGNKKLFKKKCHKWIRKWNLNNEQLPNKFMNTLKLLDLI